MKKGQELGKLSVASVPKTVEMLPGSGTMVLDPSNAVGSLTTKLPSHCIVPAPGMGPPANGVYAVAPATQARHRRVHLPDQRRRSRPTSPTAT